MDSKSEFHPLNNIVIYFYHRLIIKSIGNLSRHS